MLLHIEDDELLQLFVGPSILLGYQELADLSP
jgi:hypothetical protein